MADAASSGEALLQSLAPFERASLETFAAVTNRDPASADSVETLRACGWDVQAAITRVYDGVPSPAAAAATPPPRGPHTYPPGEADEQDDADDEPLLRPGTAGRDQRAARERRRNSTRGLGTAGIGLQYLRQVLTVPLVLLAYPATLLYELGIAILGFFARLFRNDLPRVGLPRRDNSPATAAEHFIQSVERVSGLTRRDGSSSAASSTAIAGGSTTTARRHPTATPRRTGRRVPDFFVGGYEEAVRFARDEQRVLMVVLTTEENERDGDFKRDVLVHETINDVIEEERLVIWGGDVGEREAYTVARSLSSISLPFVAFIALQPNGPPGFHHPDPSTASTSSPRMRLVSRIEYLSSNPLNAPTLNAHLQTVVLPRTKPYLSRLIAQKAQREADRRAREDAERRVLENARRDEEKVLAVRRREAERLRVEQERVEREEREAAERAVKQREAEDARQWRRWKRGELDARGEANLAEEGAVRVAVRLGNGQRAMRTFGGADRTEAVYAWTECELEREADSQAPSAGDDTDVSSLQPPRGYEQRYHFRLAATFPRQIIPLPAHLASPSTAHLDAAAAAGETTVGEAFRGLGKTVNLVIDGLETRRRLSRSTRDEESDEEEEEEEE